MTAATLPATELTKTKQQILAVLPPLKAEVALLTVDTEEDYQKASALLVRIQTSKKWWLLGDGLKWKGINAIIKPFKEGLDGLYEMKNDGLIPHDEMEDLVKSKMKGYKLVEAKRLAEEQAARDVEARRLQEEIDKKAARENASKTVQVRERLIGQRMELESQHKALTKTKAAPVKAAGSAARSVKKPIIKDFETFARGILALHSDAADGIPLDLLQVNPERLALMWKHVPELVAQLPGVEIETDVVIAGR